MDARFITIVQKLVAEQGKNALIDPAKCKAFLGDYTKNEFKKDRHLLTLAIEAGCAKEIANASDLVICKKIQIRFLQDERFIDERLASDAIDLLALALRANKNKSLVSPQGESVYDILNRAKNASANKNYQEAITLYTKALALYPNNSEAYYNRGDAYFILRDYKKAIADYTQSIKIEPNLVLVYINRGNTYRELGDISRAIANYNQAIKIDPNYAVAYINRGLAYSSLDDAGKAIADFTQAININPDYVNAYNNRGLVYYRLYDYKNATKDARKAYALGNSTLLEFMSKHGKLRD